MSGKRKHKTADEILQYLRGELSYRERHAFEREMETDPFEKEALEGLEGVSAEEAEEDILSLHAQIRKRLSRRRRYTFYSIAATVASLLIVGTVFLQIHDFNPGTAVETLSEDELPAISREKMEQKEPMAGVVAEEPAEAGDEILLHAVEPAAEEAGTESGLVAEMAVEDSDDVADLAGAEPESGYMAEEIVAVEAAPAPSQSTASPSQAARAPEAKGTTSSRGKRVRKERDRESKMAFMEEDAEPYSYSQVSGVVISAEDMEPLPEAAVAVKGGDTGVLADMQGRFLLPAEENTSTTLIASFVGMETREYPVTAGAEVELVMQPDIASLDEVVVVEPATGYTALKQYIEDNIRFPEWDTSTTRAVVILKFTLSENGEIMNMEPLRSSGPYFTEEAFRLINEGTTLDPVRITPGTTEEVVRLRIVFKR